MGAKAKVVVLFQTLLLFPYAKNSRPLSAGSGAGGALNVIPQGSDTTNDYPDSRCEEGRFAADDYSEQLTLLDGLYASYQPAIPLADFESDNAPHFTFTANRDGFWNRKLDYLFTNGTFVPGSSLTHQNEGSGGVATIPLSDHAPISVRLELP